jgi:hypothetical protein
VGSARRVDGGWSGWVRDDVGIRAVSGVGGRVVVVSVDVMTDGYGARWVVVLDGKVG